MVDAQAAGSQVNAAALRIASRRAVAARLARPTHRTIRPGSAVGYIVYHVDIVERYLPAFDEQSASQRCVAAKHAAVLSVAALDGEVLKHHRHVRSARAEDLENAILPVGGTRDNRAARTLVDNRQSLVHYPEGGVVDQQAAVRGVGQTIRACGETDGIAGVAVAVGLKDGVTEAEAGAVHERRTRHERGRDPAGFHLFEKRLEGFPPRRGPGRTEEAPE